MNPLSPLIYYRRHKRWTVTLTAFLALAVTGLYLFVGLARAIYIEPAYITNRYLSKFSLVQPDLEKTLATNIVARIRANPDVALALPQSNVSMKVANVGGAYFPFRLIGLQAADIDAVLTQCGVTLKAGQLPQPHTNGVALAEEIVTALNLEIGDTFDRADDEKLYSNIVSPLRLVGILSGEVRLGIMSYEYLNSEANYRDLAHSGLLVIARPGHEAAVADFLRQTTHNAPVKAYTNQSTTEQVARDQQLLYTLGIPIVLLVTTAILLMLGVIHQFAFARRLPELGTLHAFGYSRGRLACRLTLETAGPALAGWGLGIGLAWVVMAILSDNIYAPQGFAFDPLQVTALPFVMPMPLAVIGFTLFTTHHTLARMDAVSIVEQEELSLEVKQPHGAARSHSRNQPRPLASTTFYRRHKSQAAALISSLALMIVGTTLIIFVFAASQDALRPTLNNFSRVSAVAPNNRPLEASVVEQIRAHPAVERIIPAYTFTPVKISIPPMFPEKPIETLCVMAEDMNYLVELYRLKLAEGHLPRLNTNEIVLPWSVAQNRNIRVGEVIGNRDHPIYPGAPSLPIEVVVSGIFAPAETLADETWLSFMSLEFVDQYREGDLLLIVAPRAGQKAALDAWLESHIAGETRIVYTYRNQQTAFQREMRPMLMTFALMESVMILVAALALAGLNYIFVSQRQAEFGVLNALGFSRWQLVWRTVHETLFTTSTAWFGGMLVCAIILLSLQSGVYTPVGLRLNFFNTTSWLYTLPLPALILAISASTVSWMLARLDPVSIIERRA